MLFLSAIKRILAAAVLWVGASSAGFAASLGLSDLAVILQDRHAAAWNDCSVELGGFSNGFVPTAANSGQWADYWVTTGTGYATRNTGGGEVSAELTAADNTILAAGRPLYVWAFSAKARTGTEWGLYADPSWTMPAVSPLMLAQNIKFTDQTTAIYGHYSESTLTAATATTDLGISAHPVSVAVADGGTMTLTAAASGVGPFSYQWRKNGEVLAGATGATLTISGVHTTDSGYYTVDISNGITQLSSAEAGVAVAGLRSRVVNLSVRAHAGLGENVLIAGFVTEGASTRLLLRAPTLAAFGVAGSLVNPQLTLFGNEDTPLTDNENWADAPNLVELLAATDLSGTFGLPVDGEDAAILRTLAPNLYTVHVSGVDATDGIALAEIYDVSVLETGRLRNVSGRGTVAGGDQVMIGGFVISGTTAKTMLLRGIGPGLVPYGITAALGNPRLTLYHMQDDGAVEIAANDDWQSDPDAGAAIAAAALRLGAFPLADDSPDAALLLTLAPGAYTVHLSSADQFLSGVGLVEIYDADED